MSGADDSFWTGMLDIQTSLSQRYADEVARLRKANAELRKTIAEFPSDMTAMQDRITMLEQQVARSGAPNRSEPNGTKP